MSDSLEGVDMNEAIYQRVRIATYICVEAGHENAEGTRREELFGWTVGGEHMWRDMIQWWRILYYVGGGYGYDDSPHTWIKEGSVLGPPRDILSRIYHNHSTPRHEVASDI